MPQLAQVTGYPGIGHRTSWRRCPSLPVIQVQVSFPIGAGVIFG